MRHTKTLTFIMLALFTLPTFALPLVPLAQRTCKPDDLQIVTGSSPETTCEWTAANKQASLQVTLHSSIPYINGTCIFTPANQSTDAIFDVVGHKAARYIKNLVIKDNVITFQVYNDNDASDPNINVMFYLNKTDTTYTGGDKIHCSFSPAS